MKKQKHNAQVIDYLGGMVKKDMVQVARQHGWKGMPESMNKEQLAELLQSYSMDNQRAAMLAVGWQVEDIDGMLIDTFEETPEPAPEPPPPVAKKAAAKKAEPVPEPEPEPAKPRGKADVNQIAAMFQELMEVSKANVTEEDVRKIAQQIADTEAESLAEALMLTSNLVTEGFGELRQEIDTLKQQVGTATTQKIEIKSFNGTHTLDGVHHKQFKKLLQVVGSRNAKGTSNLNLWLAGPSGAGKTTAAENASVALGMKFYTNGSIANKYELTGFVDAHGNLQRTPFRDAWEHGGVYLFDEIDGSVPAAVLAFNAALANGLMAFPDGMLRRNANCVVIAAANTMGQGATTQFVGRMKQDFAFLNRFVKMVWAVDEDLERKCVPKEFHDWVDYVQRVRRGVERKGINVMVTMRASVYGAQLLGSGLDLDDVIELTMRCDMSPEQWAMVEPNR